MRRHVGREKGDIPGTTANIKHSHPAGETSTEDDLLS
jgi:hypothetical protein